MTPTWGQNKSKKPKTTKSTLEEVTGEALNEVLEDNDEVLVLFYEDNKSPQVKKLLTTLEKIDLSDLGDVPFVRCSDSEEAEEFGIQQNELPKVVLFDNSVPDEYTGDILDTKSKFAMLYFKINHITVVTSFSLIKRGKGIRGQEKLLWLPGHA